MTQPPVRAAAQCQGGGDQADDTGQHEDEGEAAVGAGAEQMPDADGASAPSIATFLATPRTQPGGVLSGEVRLKGGDADTLIDRIGLGLVASTRPVREDSDHGIRDEFSQVQISGAVILRPGEEEAIAFQVAVPWGIPLSEINGLRLPDMALGVCTEVVIAAIVGRSDLDLVAVTPVPSESCLVAAFRMMRPTC
ncbi:sporulation protein [Nonomuraea purpurea]|uniref:Sporulation protein n=1 Tax=Nonomuraea purpurea TaxID=1849276 RepID=A0ABV8GQX2_9ACTN